jgi:DNA invertase Pin-like site-specific DNA recombinase
VSNEEQKEAGYSLQSQKRLLAEKMARDCVEQVHDPIVDVESSYRDFYDRQGLRQLWRLASEKQIDYVYVYVLDRLGRNVAETPYLMYKLKSLYGVVTRTIAEEYNFEDPIDYVLAALRSYSGHVEAKKIGERTQRGKIEKFRAGKWVGPEPFAYRKNAEDELEKRPGFESIVSDIFTTYVENASIKELADYVRSKYSTRFGKLAPDKLRRILTNPVYKGCPRYGHVDISSPHLAMVPADLYDKAQVLINKKAARCRVKRYRKPQSFLDDLAAEYGFDRVMNVLNILKPHCPKCGAQMVGNGSKFVKGLKVRLPNFVCRVCKYERMIPSASELERFKGKCCPDCTSMDLEIERTLHALNKYTCKRCGFCFEAKDGQHPEETEETSTCTVTTAQDLHKNDQAPVQLGSLRYATDASVAIFKEAKRRMLRMRRRVTRVRCSEPSQLSLLNWRDESSPFRQT